jgi:phospholipase D1/2
MASVAQPPHSIFEMAKLLTGEAKATPSNEEGHPQEPPLGQSMDLADTHPSNESPSSSRHQSPRMSNAARRSIGTPSGRTGPPRSISYNFSASSHPASRANSHDDNNGSIRELPHLELPENNIESFDQEYQFAPARTPFRGALEFQDSEQKEREREAVEKRAKKKERDSYFHDVFNPSRWITDSPKSEHQSFPMPPSLHEDTDHERPEKHETSEPQPLAKADGNGAAPSGRSPTMEVQKSSSPSGSTRRTKSLPHIRKTKEDGEVNTAPKWNRLRSLIPAIAQQRREQSNKGPSAVVSQSVNITDELMVGGLSTLMLKLWFERDEKDHRRVPVLFHRLRIRVSDSLHPLHGNKAVFRIECEYANGAARWVVYRQLREFLSLHTHYTISNAYNRNVDALPDFPRAGLPYFNFLKDKGDDVSRQDFARMQRESLENYLIGLIRAVVSVAAIICIGHL